MDHRAACSDKYEHAHVQWVCSGEQVSKQCIFRILTVVENIVHQMAKKCHKHIRIAVV